MTYSRQKECADFLTSCLQDKCRRLDRLDRLTDSKENELADLQNGVTEMISSTSRMTSKHEMIPLVDFTSFIDTGCR
jgi:hypothetical protein